MKTGKAAEICEIMVNTFEGADIMSMTADNGTEFADRELAEFYLQTPMYFATPYHSWER